MERVVERLRAAADPSGFVPFDRFMAIALYTPEVGYYSQPTSPLGPAGDFYTAAHVHPLFGATIAARVRAVRNAVAADRPFRVVELGPGDGTLARTVLDALAAGPQGSRELEYVLVERAPARAAEALARAEPAAVAAGVRLRLAASMGDEGPALGVVIANEVLDAQPVRRIRWDGGTWRELGVRLEGDRALPAESDLVRPVPPPALPVGPEPGVILEVSPLAESLVREVADHLIAGTFLLLDYGMEEAELLRGHPRGTLASVRGHRVVSDAYDAPGSADLSAFVNFSRVRECARRSGLVEVANCSQAEALASWGFPTLLDEAIRRARSSEEEVRTRLAAKNLLFGFERFRALELAPASTARALGRLTS